MRTDPIVKADEDDEIDDSPSFVIKTVTKYVDNSPMKEHSVYIYGAITEPKDYLELCNTLRQATLHGDYFKFRIASPGGSCNGFVALYNAIKDCDAVCEMHVDSYGASNGASLALSGDMLVMHPNTFLMFHNYSGGALGKGQEMMAHVAETAEWIHQYMKDIYQPFLTKAEVDGLFKDQDIYLHAHDKSMKARIKRHHDKTGVGK